MSWEDDVTYGDTKLNSSNSGTYIKPSVSGSYQGDGAENTGWSIGSALNSAKSFASGIAGNALSGLTNAKSMVNGLLGGGVRPITPTWSYNNSLTQGNSSGQTSEDWRVRVTVHPKLAFMSSAMMAPLRDTNGVVFPIVPQMSITNTARYTTQQLTHSNYSAYFYDGSDVAEIQINGEFVVQNINDGKYLLAALQFFRTTTKMFFGAGSQSAPVGTPPPLVYLSGYGSHYFDNVTCIVKSCTHTMTPDVDYVPIPGPDGSITRLPTQSNLQVTLQPIYSRTATTQFNLDSFANGDLVKAGFL